MSPTVIATGAAKQYTILVLLEYGESFSVQARYARYSDHVTVNEVTYTSLPEMDVTFPTIDGGLEDAPFDVTLPVSELLGDRFSRGEPHSPVRATVYEVSPDDLEGSLTERFYGFLTSATRNPGGMSGMVKLSFSSPKALLDIPLGIPATTTCVWQFGDDNCGYPAKGQRESATVISSGRFLELSGLSSTTDQYWRKGFVTCNGLSIMVRSQPSGNILEMVQSCPARWVGLVVVCTPGCNKSVSECKNKWNNAARFGGIGLAIPNYNPNFETS